MRTRLLPALALATLATAPAGAQQPDLHLRVGATYASTLLTDQVGVTSQVETRQKLAPTIAAAAGLPVGRDYGARLELALGRGDYEAREGGTTTSLGTLTTFTGVLGLNGPVWKRLRWHAGVGLVKYLPSDDTGIFLQGGPWRALASGGLDWREPALRGWDLEVSARGDFHRFSTAELRARDFGGTQGVGRITLTVGLARRGSR